MFPYRSYGQNRHCAVALAYDTYVRQQKLVKSACSQFESPHNNVHVSATGARRPSPVFRERFEHTERRHADIFQTASQAGRQDQVSRNKACSFTGLASRRRRCYGYRSPSLV